MNEITETDSFSLNDTSDIPSVLPFTCYVVGDEPDCHTLFFCKGVSNHWLTHTKMLRHGVDRPTIFDYLNNDCWQHILEFVPIKDIICSERVSRQWQRIVLEYLQRTRIGIQHRIYRNTYSKPNIRWMEHWLDNWPSFRLWTIKLGSSLVASYCYCAELLAILNDNCPDIEALMFFALREELLQSIDTANFKCLQWVRFKECFTSAAATNAFSRTWVENVGGRAMLRFERIPISDNWVSQFLTSNVLEEIELDEDNTATGQCLTKITSTRLKSLVFQQCKALELRPLLAAIDQFSMIKKLVLRDLNRDLCREIHLVVDKIHGLEHLDVCSRWMGRIQLDECVCRLSSLKHLGGNSVATDAGLEAVTRCCKELCSLELENCSGLSSRGIAAMCRNAGRRLLALCIQNNHQLTDDDVVGCVKSCPKLALLDLDGCSQLTGDLLPRAAQARRELRPRPPALRLAINSFALDLRTGCFDVDKYDGLILAF